MSGLRINAASTSGRAAQRPMSSAVVAVGAVGGSGGGVGAARRLRCTPLAAAAASLGAPWASSSASPCLLHARRHQQQQQQQQRAASTRHISSTAAAAASGGTAEAASTAPAAGSSGDSGGDSSGVRSFDLRLPDCASGATGLDALDDVELQQQAQDWGYTRLGRPFPEGVPLAGLAASLLDERHFQPSAAKALAHLAAAAALVAAGCAWQAHMHSVCPLWQRLLCWLAVGTGYFGAFQAAADAARFALWPSRPVWQDVVGALIMAPALVPFEGWRLQQFNHLMRPNMLGEDSPLWHPLTTADVAALPSWLRAPARLVHATPLRFLARGLSGWASCWDGLDLRRHPPAARPWVLLGWALPAAFAGLALPALLAAGGAERLVGWWLGPWVVFHAWQGLVAVAQSGAPHVRCVPDGLEYDRGQAVVNGTVTLEAPWRWLEWLVGAANLGLPRMLSISVPYYNARAAQDDLEARLGPYLTSAPLLSPRLLLNLSTRWPAYDAERRRYVGFEAGEGEGEQKGEQSGAAGTAQAAAA